MLVASGTITVAAADDGIRGKDSVVVADGKVTITSAGDGLKADNYEDATAGYIDVRGGAVRITAGGDGIDAATDLVVTGEFVTATTGGGHGQTPSEKESTKGLKSGTITVDASDDAVHSNGSASLSGATVELASGDYAVRAESELLIGAGAVDVIASVEGLEAAHITISGGDTDITASDDGVNAAGGTTDTETTAAGAQGGGGGGEAVGQCSLTVTEGTLVADSGGDGLDSNGTATMTGGTVVVAGPTGNGNGALDMNGDSTVDGGTLMAVGSAGMIASPSTDSKRGWVSATLDSTVEAGTVLHLVNGDQEVIATYTTTRVGQSLVASTAGLTAGEEYAVNAGGTSIATVTAGEAAAGGMRGGGAPR